MNMYSHGKSLLHISNFGALIQKRHLINPKLIESVV